MLDTLKEALRNTAGISFLAAEEEGHRLRGFSCKRQATSSLTASAIRSATRSTGIAFRHTIQLGSMTAVTGGAVNQVSELPRPLRSSSVSARRYWQLSARRGGYQLPHWRRFRVACRRDGDCCRQTLALRQRQVQRAGAWERPQSRRRELSTTCITTTVFVVGSRGFREPPIRWSKSHQLLRHGE